MGEADMSSNAAGSRQRIHASHGVLEAELDHLDWATRQPMSATLNATYWRRRLLDIKIGFELTQQQILRIEALLHRVGSVGAAAAWRDVRHERRR
jgi:hypothetical protein